MARSAPQDDRPDSLQSKLAAAVAAEPGIGIGELQKRTRCGWGAMYRALEPLVLQGTIVQARVGRRTLLYPRGDDAAPGLPRSHAVLKGRTTRQMVQLLASSRGVTANDLRVATDKPERTVYYHLAKLEEAGLVETTAQVRGRLFFPTSLLVRLVASGGHAV